MTIIEVVISGFILLVQKTRMLLAFLSPGKNQSNIQKSMILLNTSFIGLLEQS